MQLPFTHEQFLDVFADYNRTLWPAAILIWLLTVAAIVDLYRRGPAASRLVSAVLALQWAWAGLAYHLAFFRNINPAAWLFGAAFLLQAGFLSWRAVLGSRLTLRPRASWWGRIGSAFIVYALLYPGLCLLLGLTFPRCPSFGVPCPTVILTLGVFMLAPRKEVRLLSVLPLMWAAVGGSAALVLDIRADYALLAAGVICLVFVASGSRRARHVDDVAPGRPVAHDEAERREDA